jgi:hypothetical protein
VTPETVLDAAIGVLRLRPPAGVDPAYIDGFLSPNRPAPTDRSEVSNQNL